MAGMAGTLHGGSGKIYLGAYLGCGDHTRSKAFKSKVRILGCIPASPDAPADPPEPPLLVVLRSFPGGRARFAFQRMRGGYREEKMPPGDRGELAKPRRAPPEAGAEDGAYRAECRCLECAESDSMLPNFSFDSAAVKKQRRREGLGPRVRQRAFRTYPDVKRQLRLLRLDSPENLAAVDRCVVLSLAAFDVESITYEPGDDHVLDANLELEPVSSTRLDSSVRRVQKICLIGHHDNLMRERGEGVRVFRARTNDEEVVARYADFFLEQQREAKREKALLLAPLYEVVDAFESAHTEFCREHKKEQRFRSTLLGELQASLDRIRDRFYIFGLHSRSYDNVLLAKPLASNRASAKRGRTDFGYQRHGNKIRNMHVGKVMFRDVTDLTGPTSLSEIAATCGLAEKKGIFPFAILDSLEALDKPELPSKCAAWRSELNDRGPTQEEVDRALLEFREMGCSTVGDYLEAYLKTDVTLTLDCACSLIEKFEKKMSINPILNSKLTISSYAHSVVHARLEAEKAPAIFSPSVPSTYALLRNANKGGLVCVLRNVCDPEDRSEGAAVNGHLVRGLQRRAGAERPLPPPRKLTLVDEVATDVLSRHPEGLPLDNPPGLSVLPPETRR